MSLKEILPQLKEPPPQDCLTYELFSKQPEYVAVNRSLIREVVSKLPPRFTHVDIATGTGLVPKLIIEHTRVTCQAGKVIGIDPNGTSLDIARRTTQPTENVTIEFIEGYGQDLKQLLNGRAPEDGVDGATIFDAIHEIKGEDNKKQVLLAMASVLKPDGVLSLNSAFTTFGIEPNPMAWGRWKLKAFSAFGGRKNKEVTAIEIHTPDQYRQMIEDVGLIIIHEAKKVVELTHEALIGISRYPRFIEGVFDDMVDQGRLSLREKSEALIKALEGIKSMPRGWYEIIAIKPPNPAISLA